ncbi:FxsA family protein [Actinomadura oligospora]|uniref:FxsA family protein n=1 Tax=Actinomadura oligospora TaxID=111804 RepID=UPI0004B7DAD6|nr:FxsA family protein [Actinomadura oligospora]
MLPLVLVLSFLLLPVLEITLIIQVGQAIGGWPTAGLLAAGLLAGGWLVRREGRRAWRALNAALSRGEIPERELGDAALVMAGGVLLMIPGFLTDLLGLMFVLPFTRPPLRRLFGRLAARRLGAAQSRAGLFPPGMNGPGPGGFGASGGTPFGDPFGRGGGAGPSGESGPSPRGTVVQGEVIHDDDRP